MAGLPLCRRLRQSPPLTMLLALWLQLLMFGGVLAAPAVNRFLLEQPSCQDWNGLSLAN